MLRTFFPALIAAALAVAPAWAADGKTSKAQLGQTAPPKELKEPVRQQLGDQTVQVVDDKGNVFAEFWFRKEVPGKGDVSGAVKYGQVDQTVLLGAVQFNEQWSDYRKQRVKAGVYTLRLAFQPMDGDHMGTAPYNEFVLLSPASLDATPGPIEFKKLFEYACKAAASSHGAILMLYPNDKPGNAPELLDKGGGNFVVNWKQPVAAGGQKGVMGLGLTVFGHTTAE